MSSCILCIAIKHQQLINNCYPIMLEADPNPTPQTSELSYLIFYAKSKPAKLSKVGAYLEKKVRRDIRKGREGSNQVSLQILKELIEKCKEDLNIFSIHIFKILNMLLDTRKPKLLDLCRDTFVAFCQNSDGEIIRIDSDFIAEYKELLNKFSGFCDYSLALQMRYIGHSAVLAAVRSKDLNMSSSDYQLNILLPPLTAALTKRGLQYHKTRKQNEQSPTLDNENMNINAVDELAVQTISEIFNQLSGPSLTKSISLFLSIMDRQEKWWPPEFTQDTAKFLLHSLLPNNRSRLVDTILDRLGEPDERDLKRQASMATILDTILNENEPIDGLSVLDVLHSLLKFLIKTAKHHPLSVITQYDHNLQDESKSEDLTVTIQKRLMNSIGGLVTYPYYDNQLMDILNRLFTELRADTSMVKYVDNLTLHEHRCAVLACIDSVLDRLKSNSSQVNNKFNFSLEVWATRLSILNDKNPKTRVAFCKTLYRLLTNIPPTKKIDPKEKYPTHSLYRSPEAAFVENFIKLMLDWICMTDFNKTDLKFYYTFLCQLNRSYGVDATVLIVPLLFEIQRLVQEGKITCRTRQLSIMTAIRYWFLDTANFYDIQPLADYINDLNTNQKGSESDLSFTESINIDSIANEPDTFSISVNDSDIMGDYNWIDREKVAPIMSIDGHLYDEQDPHRLRLDHQLFAPWGSKVFSAYNLPPKPVDTSELTQLNPKLSATTAVGDLIKRTPLKSSYDVEKLKKRLNTIAPITDGSTYTDSTQSNSSPNHSNANDLLDQVKLSSQVDENSSRPLVDGISYLS